MRKKVPVPCLDVIMIAFFPRNTVKDHIFNTKLEKGDHYYIQTRHKDLLSHYNLILRKLRSKVRTNEMWSCPLGILYPGHPTFCLVRTNRNERTTSKRTPQFSVGISEK